MSKLPFLFLTFILIVGGCGQNLSVTPTYDARTYYDSLALDTPESAVQTFIAAYQKSDYPTVYLILSPRAQRAWQENYTLLNWPMLAHVRNHEEARVVLEDTAIAQGKFEHSGETSYEFDEIMLAAEKHGFLLVDLSGNFKIQGTQDARDTVGYPATDVLANSTHYDDVVVFRTVEAPSGKWRVYQVILPGGNIDSVPWAVPDFRYTD